MVRVFKCVREKDTVIVTILYNRQTDKYTFVNLSNGHIYSCNFDTIEDAIQDMEKQKLEGKLKEYIDLGFAYQHTETEEKCKDKVVSKICFIIITLALVSYMIWYVLTMLNVKLSDLLFAFSIAGLFILGQVAKEL